MKILVIGDPHGELPKNMDRIINKNKIEIIICIGDFPFTPKKPWLEKSWKGISKRFMNQSYRYVVDKICSYKLPVLTLRGNMWMTSRKKFADKILRRHKNLVNKFTGKIKMNEQWFVFFDVNFEPSTIMDMDKNKDFFKNRMKKNLRREKKLNKLLKELANPILICHNPPYGVVDKAFDGKHVGSKIILNAIKKHKPKLVLCGHIHEAKGKAKIGETLVINAGSHGDYVVLDTEKNKIIESNFLK